MFKNMACITTLVAEHTPHIFGISEANIKLSHDQAELQIPGYSLHLPVSINNPDLGSVARIAVYTNKSIREAIKKSGLVMEIFRRLKFELPP